jgi:hypothetical protein
MLMKEETLMKLMMIFDDVFEDDINKINKRN